jgi:hypothetical protein
MRFLNISGPGIATDEDFCPNCHVLLDQHDGDKACHCAAMRRASMDSGDDSGANSTSAWWSLW